MYVYVSVCLSLFLVIEEIKKGKIEERERWRERDRYIRYVCFLSQFSHSLFNYLAEYKRVEVGFLWLPPDFSAPPLL